MEIATLSRYLATATANYGLPRDIKIFDALKAATAHNFPGLKNQLASQKSCLELLCRPFYDQLLQRCTPQYPPSWNDRMLLSLTTITLV